MHKGEQKNKQGGSGITHNFGTDETGYAMPNFSFLWSLELTKKFAFDAQAFSVAVALMVVGGGGGGGSTMIV